MFSSGGGPTSGQVGLLLLQALQADGRLPPSAATLGAAVSACEKGSGLRPVL